VLLSEVVFSVASPMTGVEMTVEQVLSEVAWLLEQAATRDQ
jgi:hypothetical protein